MQTFGVPMPAAFRDFLLLCRLNQYGIHLSPEELGRMDPSIVYQWQTIIQSLTPEELGLSQMPPWLAALGG